VDKFAKAAATSSALAPKLEALYVKPPIVRL